MVVGKDTVGGGARLGAVLSVVLLALPGFTMFAQESAAGAGATTRPGEGLPLTGAVQVRGFEIEFEAKGRHAFTRERLLAEVSDILRRNGGKLTLDDLEEARQRLTVFYINNGYINSGAVLPEQTLDPANAVVK